MVKPPAILTIPCGLIILLLSTVQLYQDLKKRSAMTMYGSELDTVNLRCCLLQYFGAYGILRDDG